MAKAAAPDVEHLVNDYADLLNRDFSKLDVLDESFTYHSSTTPHDGLQGREALGEFFESFRAAFPDLHYTLDSGLVRDEVTMQGGRWWAPMSANSRGSRQQTVRSS